MNKIDINKPLQLADGTPVRIATALPMRGAAFCIEIGKNDNGRSEGQLRHFKADGSHIHGDIPDLQNVPEVAPQVDITKPLEAVHIATGKVVPMIFDRMSPVTSDRFYTKTAPDGAWSNDAWDLDGQDACHYKAWTIRNVAPKIDWTKPLETVDGQRVELLPEKSDDGEYWRVRIGVSWGVRHYSEDGKHRFGDQPDIRNVAEVPAPAAPALDLTKPLQTRDGRSVVLITSEGRGKYPVLGYVGDDTGPTSGTSEGKYQAHTAQRDEDLVNVADKPDVFYGSIYRFGDVNTWTADNVSEFPSEEGRATVKVTFPKDGKPTVELL
ncbi:hypothetical protein [Novosphingobium sp.]|uniref:hypothetical protein n=1 Tax=Novosphingobium sp. TaxID=1874826 RepID=UPI003D6CD7CC